VVVKAARGINGTIPDAFAAQQMIFNIELVDTHNAYDSVLFDDNRLRLRFF
jgi:hypothetical protein